MKKIAFFLLFAVLALTSCDKNGNSILSSISGMAYEVLYVTSTKDYKTPAGKEVYNVLNSAIPELPQPESQFVISYIPYEKFSSLLKTSRNIVFLVLDSTKYTTPQIHFINSKWAQSQAIVNITAPNSESLMPYLEKNGDAINKYINKAERERQIAYFKKNINRAASDSIFKMFGCKIIVPTSINKYKSGKNFFWMSDGNPEIRKDIVIYSYPYTSTKQFERDNLLHKHDSILAANIPGSFEGSYMGTEYKYLPPVMDTITVDGEYCIETRGLWKMINGAAMGGPFVSHTMVDEVNNRLITIEGFVFGPGKHKRLPIKQVESMIYTLVLPQNINAVTITANKKTKK